jgi:hypothetical protein
MSVSCYAGASDDTDVFCEYSLFPHLEIDYAARDKRVRSQLLSRQERVIERV